MALTETSLQSPPHRSRPPVRAHSTLGTGVPFWDTGPGKDRCSAQRASQSPLQEPLSEPLTKRPKLLFRVLCRQGVIVVDVVVVVVVVVVVPVFES